MERTIHLGLYGSIEHGPSEDLLWDIYQTEPLARLRDISLSSTPSRFAPHGVGAGRFQHSVGVSFLARKLCDWRPTLREHRDVLACAALCHDIGSPPFSHISELFFYELTGRTHEQQTSQLLAKGTELRKVMSAYDVDADEVVSIINGEHDLLGPLLAGSIDLDNADNSLHLLRSLGYEYLPYHPLQLINAFKFRDGQLVLDSAYLAEILGWAEARRQLYALLHADPNLSSATMLYRALEFAFADGQLGADFFDLGESDALFHLRARSGKESEQLVDQLLRWRHYPLAHAQVNTEEDPRLVGLYDDWDARKQFADQLAKELKLKPHEVCLYVGRDRGQKSIDLPWVGDYAEPAQQMFANRKGAQRIAVFVAKKAREKHGVDKKGHIPRVAEVTGELIASLPEATAAGHIFF